MREDWAECTFEELTESLKRGPFGGDLKKAFFVPKGHAVYEQQHAIGNDFSNIRYFIDNERYELLRACNVGPGDYIVSCSGTMGKIARLPKNSPEGVINQALLRIRINEGIINHNYFLEFFRSSIFQKKILKDSRGSGMQNMAGIKEIKPIVVEIPPKPEQSAIVAKIEELFSDLDQGIADLKKAGDQLKVYRQAVLKKAFEGELTKEWREVKNCLFEDWKKNSISDISEVLNGDRGKNYPSRAHYVAYGIPFVSAGNIGDNKRLKQDLNYISEEKFDLLRAGKLQRDDIVYCIRGSIGKFAIIDFDKGAIASSLCIIRTNSSIDRNYFCHYLASPLCKLEIDRFDNGTAQPNLSAKDFKKFQLPLPSIEEQYQIIQEIESRLSVCDKVEESITESLEKAKALRQSILKKAFEGTLLSEEEIVACKAAKDYEPASDLLEKIKAEKKKP